nr:uncharacterized protein LOC112941868 [Solanum lycopersicum]
MAAPPTPQEGASQTRPPLFNGKYYGWWKNRMMDHLIGENPDLWGVILDGPTIPMKTATDGITKIPKERKEWNVEDKLAIQNNAKAKKILICGIGPDEYNRFSSCQDAKAIWETLQTAHEGTTQVKKSKIDNLNRQYELFRMEEGETIQHMHTRFTSIINEMYSLGEIVPNGKVVRKLLSVLPETWESKVEAITEARDLDSLGMDKLIGNLITYELKKNQEKEIGGKRKERNLVLKATASDDFEDENIALITKRFTRMLKRGQPFQKKAFQKRSENTKEQVCHKCGSPDHFIKFCPLWAVEQKKVNYEKGKDIKKDKFVPSNRRMTIQEADMSMKRAFAAMGNSSDEEFEGDEIENQSLLALEQEDDYDFLALVAVENKEERETCRSQETILALMAGSDSEKEEEEEDINEKVSLHNLQDNLGSYSKRELESLLYTLIDEYKTIDSKRELIMEDYASLREENKSLEKQNLHLLSKNTKLSKNLELVIKRNETLSKELLVTKTEAENGMRWTRSSILLDNIHNNRTFEKHGIGFDRTSSQGKNPNIDCLCMHCGLGSVKRKQQQWYLDSACSRHMTGDKRSFLSLKNIKGGNVAFGNGKSGEIEGIGKVGTMDTHAIENERDRNVYKVKTVDFKEDNLKCLSAVSDCSMLWHKRMGHISMTTINKLISKDLVRELPTKSFKDNQVCGTCIQGKQVRSSFKPKLTVSTTKPLELLHMDLCRPMRVQSRGGKRYVFVIVDDYSRFTWTLFLATKDETFTMFEAFAKLVQKKFNKEIISIRPDHGLEFENSQFLQFCTTNGI